MTSYSSNRFSARLTSFSRYAGLIVAALGGLVSWGWIFDIQPLKSVLPGLATMKFNTAFGFVLGGLVLWLGSEESAGRKKRWLMGGGAALVALLGLVTLGEYLFGSNFGIDQLVVRDPETPAAFYPGRMSLATAWNFILLGAALLLLKADLRWRFHPSQLLALLAGAVACSALIGYLYGVESLYSAGTYSSMALHTALSSALLSIGVLCARPQRGFMQIVSAESAGGVIFRRLFPVAVVIPIVIGWLRLWGQEWGWYDTNFGLALMVMLSIAALGIVIWLNAGWLNRLDANRRRAEETVHKSQLQLASVINTAMDAIITVDEKQRILIFNPSAELMFRRFADKVIGKPLTLLIPERLRSQHEEDVRAFGKTSVTKRGMGRLGMVYGLRANGEEFPLEVSISQTESGGRKTFTAILRDITERRRAEAELRDSEKRFRALIEYSSDEVSLITADGRLLYESPSASPTLGYTPNQFLGQDMFQLVHPDDLERVRGQFARLTQEPGRHLRDQFRLRHSSGEWRWMEAVGTNLLTESAVQAIVINYHDITERKQAEEELRQSEARKSAVFESALDCIITIDQQGRIREFNPAAEATFHYRRSEVLGKEMAELIIPPALREQHRRGLAKYLATGEGPILGRQIELAGMRADGSEFPVELTVSRIISDGPPVFMAFLRDITGRKQAVQAIREAEERYRTLLEQLPMIVYINSNKDIADTTYVSPQIQSILGYTPEEWLADPKSWQRALHPEDRQSVLEKVQRVNSAGEPFDMEFRMVARDGRVVWFRDQAALIRDPKGEPLFWQGLMIDITENKQRERELEAVAAISSALREIQSTDEILLLLLSEALTSVFAQHGGIWLYDPDKDEISLAYETGQSVNMPSVMKRGEGIVGLAVESEDVVISDELHKDPRLADGIRELVPTGLSAVCLPLRAADKVIGAMLITTQLPHEFMSSDIRILMALGQIGGSAIHRTSLYEQTVNQLGRLAALRTIDMAITSSLDLGLTLNVVLDQVIGQCSVDAADILLLKPELQILDFASGKGFRTHSIESASLHLGEGLPGRAAVARKTLFVPDLAQTELPFKRRKLLEDEKFISYYAAPLIAKGKIKGVLEIFHRSALTHDPELIQFLEALADQAAIAIDNSALFYDLQRSNIDLALAYDATIEGWSRALDLRDKETEGHTQRVTDMALKLARAVGVSDEELVHIRRGALLHDIGKMGVPDGILLKPGKLTDEEWELMRKHPGYAYEMLMPIAYLRSALDIPYCHHEKWDGTGYPRGLRGEQIPLSARIFAVVDVWDALRSDRPYRAGWDIEKVLDHLREQSGRHFDPRVVQIFLEQVVDSQ